MLCQILLGCISFDSYIKPQRKHGRANVKACCISFDSYIKPQLESSMLRSHLGCISFDSYIKPQLWLRIVVVAIGCISFDSYIKPQQALVSVHLAGVVYLLTPTSNHNKKEQKQNHAMLYIF